MPILAGRAFALGELDLIGLAFAIAILFWIPTHIITFQVRYQADYESAGVPTFPAAFGVKGSRAFIAYSSLLAAGMMCLSGIGLGLHWGVMGMLLGLSAAMLALAVLSLLRPSERINFGLFKFASVYMLGSMVLMVI
jgi:protoheme IX farnesyltransferase